MRFTSSVALRASSALAIASLLAACSSSGASGPIVTANAPDSTVTTSTSASVSLPSLTASGYTVTGTLPMAAMAASVSETLSTTAPSTITPLLKRRDTSNVYDEHLYLTFTSNVSVVLSASPSLTYTSSKITSGTTYSIAEYAGGTVVAPFGPSVTATSDTVSFASVDTPVTIGPVTFALYTGTPPSASASPAPTTSPVASTSPAASTSPSPSPNPTPVASPTANASTLSFDASNPGTTQSYSVSESGYSGTFTESIACTENPAGQSPASDAFVAQLGAGSTNNGTATVAVEGGAESGTCTVTSTDTFGQSVSVAVDVTATDVTINGTHRP